MATGLSSMPEVASREQQRRVNQEKADHGSLAEKNRNHADRHIVPTSEDKARGDALRAAMEREEREKIAGNKKKELSEAEKALLKKAEDILAKLRGMWHGNEVRMKELGTKIEQFREARQKHAAAEAEMNKTCEPSQAPPEDNVARVLDPVEAEAEKHLKKHTDLHRRLGSECEYGSFYGIAENKFENMRKLLAEGEAAKVGFSEIKTSLETKSQELANAHEELKRRLKDQMDRRRHPLLEALEKQKQVGFQHRKNLNKELRLLDAWQRWNSAAKDEVDEKCESPQARSKDNGELDLAAKARRHRQEDNDRNLDKRLREAITEVQKNLCKQPEIPKEESEGIAKLLAESKVADSLLLEITEDLKEEWKKLEKVHEELKNVLQVCERKPSQLSEDEATTATTESEVTTVEENEKHQNDQLQPGEPVATQASALTEEEEVAPGAAAEPVVTQPSALKEEEEVIPGAGAGACLGCNLRGSINIRNRK
ncbi:unnamed protein product [Amoebophrya sp. A25]|nr:unnamed protein product [Amoebophrya sp. A25]|eukprot:GSA25T00016801001.1